MDISKFNLGVKGVQVSAVLLMLPFQVPVVHLCLLIKKPEASWLGMVLSPCSGSLRKL